MIVENMSIVRGASYVPVDGKAMRKRTMSPPVCCFAIALVISKNKVSKIIHFVKELERFVYKTLIKIGFQV